MLYYFLDQKELTDALQYLEQAAKNNLAEFLVGLCQVLADQNQSQVARIAAGLQVKNHLYQIQSKKFLSTSIKFIVVK